MIRTIAVLACLVYALLFFPFWATILCFIFSLTVLSPRVLLLAPAVLYDVLYAPHSGPLYRSILMTLAVAVLLLVVELIIKKTRIGELLYGVETTY
ncbi:hypothetical protein IT401_00415 [Candidatus Nomurabacteria bacterium]|nr:hypothetical protein [Candidatus Nomurabacteria bacterium]